VISPAYAAAKDKPLVSPTEARERDFYAPNSETLLPNKLLSYRLYVFGGKD